MFVKSLLIQVLHNLIIFFAKPHIQMNVEKSIKLCSVNSVSMIGIISILGKPLVKELIEMTKHDHCPCNLTSVYQLKLKSTY